MPRLRQLRAHALNVMSISLKEVIRSGYGYARAYFVAYRPSTMVQDCHASELEVSGCETNEIEHRDNMLRSAEQRVQYIG